MAAQIIPAQIIPAPLTSEDFLEFYSQQEDGLCRFELFDGEVVERPTRTEFTTK